MFTVSRFALALLLGAFMTLASAQDFRVGQIVIARPWSRPVPDGAPVGVAYFSITNSGNTPDTLLRASTPVAASVEFHKTSFSGGMARMRPLAEIAIAPGATVKVAPGGIHLMLMGLTGPLVEGGSVPLTLEFRHAGSITVQVHVHN